MVTLTWQAGNCHLLDGEPTYFVYPWQRERSKSAGGDDTQHYQRPSSLAWSRSWANIICALAIARETHRWRWANAAAWWTGAPLFYAAKIRRLVCTVPTRRSSRGRNAQSLRKDREPAWAIVCLFDRFMEPCAWPAGKQARWQPATKTEIASGSDAIVPAGPMPSRPRNLAAILLATCFRRECHVVVKARRRRKT
jgi:hypothetical protein